MRCPSCGSGAPDGAKFCPNCGRPLVTQADERRVVTVLFADLVGFTTLAESRDPEQIKNLVDGWFARLADDIVEFGGSVDKVIGDALVAIFGAPLAHEDDAERAVRAALQMQQTLSAEAAAAGFDVRMRIGVNTGEVLVGAMRAGSDYTVMGDVVNIASRLQVAADPGAVVVGPDTHDATDGVIRYEPLGLVHAKGRHGAVDAWRAIEPILQPGRRRPRRGAPLIGRDRELAEIVGFVHDAFTERRPSLVLVVGDAGIGKSRLIEEVLQVAGAAYEPRVLTGRAVPYGATNAWWPIVEIMRAACGITSADPPAAARAKCEDAVAEAGLTGAAAERLTTGLLYLMGIEDGLKVEAARARDEVALGIRTLLTRLAKSRPLLLVLADAHWADEDVLRGVDDLLSKIDDAPVVFLLSARPELSSRWQPSAAVGDVLTVELEPLDATASAELLGALLAADPGADVRAALVERSGGNPLFVEELAAVVADGGASPGALPATLRGIVTARVDALPPEERAALEDAAVVGRRAPIAAVLTVGEDRAGEEAALRALAGRELLVLDGGEVEFRSDLVREVVYGTLTKAERARRHARLAAWLERFGDAVAGDEAVGEAARHWVSAADLVADLGAVAGVPADVRDRAVDALFRAGALAEGRELHEPALRVFGTVMRLLGDEPGPARRQALIGRGVAAAGLGQSALAEADLAAAADEAREAGDEAVLARAMTAQGDLLRIHGDLDGSLLRLEGALQLWRRTGIRLGEASALRRIGWALLYAGRLIEAERALNEALEAFREGGEPRGEAWAMQQLAGVAFGSGDLELAEERLAASTSRFHELGDWGGLSWATSMLAWIRFRQRRVDEAAALAEAARDDALSLAEPEHVARISLLLTGIRLWQGRIDEALAYGDEVMVAFTGAADEWGEAQAIAPMMGALVLAGRFDDAQQLEARARALADEHADLPAFVAPIALASAHTAVSVGAGAEALAAAERAEAVGSAFVSVDLPAAKALALLQLGRVADALRVIDSDSDAPELGAARALALAAVDRLDDAAAAADEVVASTTSSYRSRILGTLALAVVAARRGDLARARAALDDAERLALATSDRIVPVVVATARAAVLLVLGQDTAEATSELEARRAALGLTNDGWGRAFAVATGAAAAPA